MEDAPNRVIQQFGAQVWYEADFYCPKTLYDVSIQVDKTATYLASFSAHAAGPQECDKNKTRHIGTLEVP